MSSVTTRAEPAPTASSAAGLTPRYLDLLDVPDLGRVLVAMQLARIAQSMMLVVLVLFSLGRYQSSGVAGIVALAAGLPGIAVSPIAGALLDRHHRTRLVVLDYLVAAGALVLVAALASASVLPAPLLVGIAAAASLTGPLSLAGLRGLLPLMTPSRLWERANAIDSSGYMIATLVGPPAGGLLVQATGGETAILAVAIVFAAAIVVLLPVEGPAPGGADGESLWRAAWAGLVYTLSNSTLRALAAAISIANITWGMMTVALPVIVLGRLHMGAAAAGGLFALEALGGIVGAFVAGSRPSTGRERTMLMIPMLATAGALALLIPDAGIVPVAAALLIVGLLNGPIDIAMFTVRQRRTAPEWIGRAFAVSMGLNSLGMPIGAGLTGLLCEWSVEVAVAVAAVCSIVAAALTYVMLPREAD